MAAAPSPPPDLLRRVRTWFKTFTEPYRRLDADGKGNIRLKITHTYRVCGEIRRLALDMGLSAGERRIAQCAALLHDVGRFEQYARYGTYLDSQSIDHAALGVDLIRDHGVLGGLSDPLPSRILQAVAVHNRKELPGNLHPETARLCAMLRDADKIDIWRVLLTHYEAESGGRNASLDFALPDLPEVAPEVRERLIERSIVDMGTVRSLTDLRLLQVGWVYDVHFPYTFERIRKRRILERFEALLPRTNEIRRFLDIARSHVAESRFEKGGAS